MGTLSAVASDYGPTTLLPLFYMFLIFGETKKKATAGADHARVAPAVATNAGGHVLAEDVIEADGASEAPAKWDLLGRLTASVIWNLANTLSVRRAIKYNVAGFIYYVTCLQIVVLD
ncbi:hypothetical protein B0H17DRAFT_1135938 [Mycena rosella]|uniref:Uncharacterized protein n=1 Tax=Mycena rosella TaxID=1033263 RepID=A0AAD7GCC8_MYCRO|nr:hypothetical protein B0H17DRAFT_1135938 [Mycena rosella]